MGFQETAGIGNVSPFNEPVDPPPTASRTLPVGGGGPGLKRHSSALWGFMVEVGS